MNRHNFKNGDIVICINGEQKLNIDFSPYPKKYEKCIIRNTIDNNLIKIDGSSILYSKKRFIKLSEFRNKKIKKIITNEKYINKNE